MAENGFSSDYPTLDITSYDLIISGTGLPASLLAAAASAAGKSVLHVDSNSFYGSYFSSLSPNSLVSFLHSDPLPPPFPAPRRLYSEIETSGSLPQPSRSFILDLAGPRALYCADPAVDLLLRSGASHHVEFKSVDGSLIYWEGRLCPVPDSRQAVFKDRSLRLAEKSQMMRFLKLVQAHIAADGTEISLADLEIPFAEFLKKQQLPPKIRTIVLYGIALADYDQESAEGCKKLLKTREGLESLALYSSSIGRFPNTIGAFIYPMYGHGELAQAFCRSAAVKGALYVLRMPVVEILLDKEREQYMGIRLASGQEILSHKLVMDPSFIVPSFVSPPENFPSESSNISKPTGKVARGVCITRVSIQKDLSNILVVFPPRSLYSQQLTTIRALQLSSNTSVCPSGLDLSLTLEKNVENILQRILTLFYSLRTETHGSLFPHSFVVHLSTLCDDAILGKEFIHAAISALFTLSDLSSSESGSSTNLDEGSEELKPPMIWSCVYVQEITQGSLGDVFTTPMPDGNFNYKDVLESTIKLFTEMYPSEEFIPMSPAPENPEEDSSSE